MIDIKKILCDPGSRFQTPEEVLRHKVLSREEKIKILCDWEYEARELAVAEEENLSGDQPDLLAQIHQALHSLAVYCTEQSSPTKHGGGVWKSGGK